MIIYALVYNVYLCIMHLHMHICSLKSTLRSISSAVLLREEPREEGLQLFFPQPIHQLLDAPLLGELLKDHLSWR